MSRGYGRPNSVVPTRPRRASFECGSFERVFDAPRFGRNTFQGSRSSRRLIPISAGSHPKGPRVRQSHKTLLLWIMLIFAFVVVWQFLNSQRPEDHHLLFS